MTVQETSSAIFLEGTCLSAPEWIDRLKLTQHGFDNLIAEGVLRKQSSSGSAVPYRLDFVGLVSTRYKTCFSLPKVYTGHQWNDADLRRTIGCLQVYQQKVRRGPASSLAGAADFHADAGTILDLFLALLSRTEESGLHTNEAETFSDDFADIDWRETLQRSLPAHRGHEVIYLESRGRKSRRVLSELGQIQAIALLDLKARIGRLSDIWLRDFDELVGECRATLAVSDYRSSDMQQIRSALETATLSATRDADRELLAMLSRWAADEFTAPNRPRLYGTTAFHTVWEDMCNEFLGDCGTRVDHAAIASQPAYCLSSQRVEVGPQRPDYLRADGKRIWIADAKWYRFELGDLPQLHDVIKQLVYEMSVSPDFTVEQNCLLLPHLGGEEWEDAGSVAMFGDTSPDSRFPEVRVISIDWIRAADAYRSQLQQRRCLEVFGLG